MKTQDLFKIHREADRLNEGLSRTFGTRLRLEDFDLDKLQDARNRLRTQISQFKEGAGFNENLENETYHKAKFMLDAINAEIAEREEFIIDAPKQEEGAMKDVDHDLRMLANDGDEEELIDALEGLKGGELQIVLQDMMDEVADELASKGMNDVIKDEDKMIEMLWDKIVDEYGGRDDSDEGGETDDEYALASAGFGSDEDYGDFGRDESIQGEEMTKVTEGEIQQASAIVTAKTMVDRVSRWIEELSGMENDTLLQLGDSIRDEMGQQQAKAFIEAVAPAIQAALENLKTTRETLSTGVRALTGEEQPAEMLGSAPEVEPGAEAGEEMPAAEPDAMNAAPAEDEFAAAEPAAGGEEAAGREKRESIDYSNRLMKVLAG
jgi:hypothetical protein